jgi:hypothetical protein
MFEVAEADLELEEGSLSMWRPPRGMLQIARRVRRCKRSAFRASRWARCVVPRDARVSRAHRRPRTEGSHPSLSTRESQQQIRTSALTPGLFEIMDTVAIDAGRVQYPVQILA